MKQMIFLSFLTLIACYIFISFILHYRGGRGGTTAVRKIPPSPLKLPLIGNLHQLGHLPHRSLRAMADKYGPIMLLHLGQVPTLIISSADLAAEIFKTQDHIFSTRPLLQVTAKLFYGGKDIAFAPYGEYWRQCKKLAILHLLSTKKVESFKHMREEEISTMVESVMAMHTLGPVDLTNVLACVAKQMTSRVTIGRYSTNEGWYDEVHNVIKEVTILIGSFNPGDYFRWLSWLSRITGLEQKFTRVAEWADQVLDTIIEKRMEILKAGEKEECFIDILLNLMGEKNADIPISIDNIKALIMDTFGAGTEAITIVMEWVMAELIKNPRVMKKLQAEIRSIAGSKSLIQEEDLVGMVYLKSVIKEVLRLHSPSPLLAPREVLEDTTIRGYYIPRGTRVMVNVWAIGHDPELWDTPNELKPERFVGSRVDFTGQNFELIPFGAGRRICPGIGFGMALIELAIANLLFKFDWLVPEGRNAEEMDMDELFGMTMRKKTKLCAIAVPHY